MAQEGKHRALPQIPELEQLPQTDEDAFLPGPSPGSGQPPLTRRGSGCHSPRSPIFFPGGSSSFLQRLRLNRSIQEHGRKLRGG